MELPKKEKHIISTSELKKNLFRLTNLFIGFSGILDDKEGFLEDFKTSLLFNEYSNMFEEEFSKLILEIAINARVLDDLTKKNQHYINLDAFNNLEMMGIIDEEIFHSPREAINKIIHADYVGHDVRTNDMKPYYMPSLQLIGKKGKKNGSLKYISYRFVKFYTTSHMRMTTKKYKTPATNYAFTICGFSYFAELINYRANDFM